MPSTEKIQVPDGKGGWTTTDAQRVGGQTQDQEKAQKAMEKAQEEDYNDDSTNCESNH